MRKIVLFFIMCFMHGQFIAMEQHLVLKLCSDQSNQEMSDEKIPHIQLPVEEIKNRYWINVFTNQNDVVVANGQTIAVYDSKTGKCTFKQNLSHPKIMSSDSKTAVVADYEKGLVQLFDMQTGECTHEYSHPELKQYHINPTNAALQAQFINGNVSLITLANREKIEFDNSTLRLMKLTESSVVERPLECQIQRIVVNSDGTQLLMRPYLASQLKQYPLGVYIWDIEQNNLRFLKHETNTLHEEYIKEDTQILTTAGLSVYMWDAKKAELLKKFTIPSDVTFYWSNHSLNGAAYNALSKLILAVSGDSNKIFVWSEHNEHFCAVKETSKQKPYGLFEIECMPHSDMQYSVADLFCDINLKYFKENGLGGGRLNPEKSLLARCEDTFQLIVTNIKNKRRVTAQMPHDKSSKKYYGYDVSFTQDGTRFVTKTLDKMNDTGKVNITVWDLSSLLSQVMPNDEGEHSNQ